MVFLKGKIIIKEFQYIKKLLDYIFNAVFGKLIPIVFKTNIGRVFKLQEV